MTGRTALLVGILAASFLVMLAEADARACMDWDGGLHMGYDDDARPFSTTWEEFRRLMERMGAREFGLMWVLSSAPFLFPALGALLVPARKINGVWIAIGLAMLLWLDLLADPSELHDCDRKGADAIFVVVPLGFLSGLGCLAAGLLLQRNSKPHS